MRNFKIIAVTHKNFDIADIGKFHINETEWNNRFSVLRSQMQIEEVMFLSTCNRVEFLLNTEHSIDRDFVKRFILSLYPEIRAEDLDKLLASAQIFEREEALRHLFYVTSSLDSLVVGEREIITQVRNAYELSRKMGLTGDLIRLAIQKSIECAKEVYTKTGIASKPVSVVSLAYRKLKELFVKPEARFLIVGAGVTNATMGKYLKKHGFRNFAVFNRTLSNAEKLAGDLGGKAFPLEELKKYTGGFDVMVTCTGASGSIITEDIYSGLVGGDTNKKIVIDLAVPGDLDEKVAKEHPVHLIEISGLKTIAEQNLREREKELSSCKAIIDRHIAEFHQLFKERKVELAMSDVPRKVKEIRETAVREVFAKEIEQLDDQSKEVLDKVIAYLEKKYISMPMKMAKEILIGEISSR